MNLIVILLNKENLYTGVLNYSKELSFGSGRKDNVYIPDFSQKQISLKWKPNGIYVDAKKEYGFEHASLPLNTMVMLEEKTNTVLFLSSEVESPTQGIKLADDCVLKFGRDESNDIVIKLPFISGRHFILKKVFDNVYIEDCGSTNGIFLNGRRVSRANMKSEDVLYILSVQIKLVNDKLFLRNVGDKIHIHQQKKNLVTKNETLICDADSPITIDVSKLSKDISEAQKIICREKYEI